MHLHFALKQFRQARPYGAAALELRALIRFSTEMNSPLELHPDGKGDAKPTRRRSQILSDEDFGRTIGPADSIVQAARLMARLRFARLYHPQKTEPLDPQGGATRFV